MREWRNFDPDVDVDGTDPNPEGDVWGCSDPDADNYNPNVTIDDGTCDYGWVAGCTDSSALNYNPEANYDDDSCVWEIGGGSNPVYGCTNPTAPNYNPLATVYDGSCEGEMFCDDVGALNYGEAGECEYLEEPECDNLCTDSAADNFNECADCIYPEDEVVCGCMDDTATNYEPLATEGCQGIAADCIYDEVVENYPEEELALPMDYSKYLMYGGIAVLGYLIFKKLK